MIIILVYSSLCIRKYIELYIRLYMCILNNNHFRIIYVHITFLILNNSYFEHPHPTSTEFASSLWAWVLQTRSRHSLGWALQEFSGTFWGPSPPSTVSPKPTRTPLSLTGAQSMSGLSWQYSQLKRGNGPPPTRTPKTQNPKPKTL